LRPYLEKNPSQKKAGGVAQGVGLEFKPQYCKKKKKKLNWILPNNKELMLGLRTKHLPSMCKAQVQTPVPQINT
jgi:hypothetical protein